MKLIKFTQAPLAQWTRKAWLCLIAFQKLLALIQLQNKWDLALACLRYCFQKNFLKFFFPNNKSSFPKKSSFYLLYCQLPKCSGFWGAKPETHVPELLNSCSSALCVILIRKCNLIILFGVSCKLPHKGNDSLILISLKYYSGFLHVFSHFTPL